MLPRSIVCKVVQTVAPPVKLGEKWPISSTLDKSHFLRKYSLNLLVWHTNAIVLPCSFGLCNKMAPLVLFLNFIGHFVLFPKNALKPLSKID